MTNNKKIEAVLDAKSYVITYDYESKLFTLKDERGQVLATGPSGKALGKKAWANGATEVQFRYDLALDEPDVIRIK